MVGQIIAALRRSPLVKDVEILAFVEEKSVQFLRVRAEIRDGSVLYVRELLLADHSKYSYHWQAQTGELLLRWDNAPHHPTLPTYPDHKHEGERLEPSARASIEAVLAELETVLKSRGQE